jgi:NADPH:quinone reductase-like Zn-dependent oxidoreductase
MSISSLPLTIKVVHQPDPQSINLLLEEVALPELVHPEDCLIRVHTCSPCQGELHWEALFPSLFDPTRERVPCTEAAGVIVQTPQNNLARSMDFKVGDEVFFRILPTQTGTLRQYTLARLSQMAHKPKNIGWVEAGATPLSSLTAWQGLFQHGSLDPGAIFGDSESSQKNEKLKVLITGASGVVGGWAVQLAALAGAGHIFALADGSKAEYVKKLGATKVIDYKRQSLLEWVAEDPSGREADLVFDCVGGATLSACWSVVKDGGVLLSVAGDPMEVQPNSTTKNLASAKWFLVEANGSHLAHISKLLGEGKCVTKVDSAVEFANFQTAFDKVEQKKAKGKVVIKVADA